MTEAVNMALEVAGCEWHYAVLMVQDDDDQDIILCTTGFETEFTRNNAGNDVVQEMSSCISMRPYK